jgi:hypothetical protein
MNIRVSGDEISSRSMVEETIELFEEMAEDLTTLRHRLRSGEFGEAKDVVRQVREVRSALHLVLEERAKVAKLSKDDAGVVYDYALDLDAARDEVCRRLACLRDAGDGR